MKIRTPRITIVIRNAASSPFQARLPHGEVFASNHQEAEKPETEADGQTGHGPDLILGSESAYSNTYGLATEFR